MASAATLVDVYNDGKLDLVSSAFPLISMGLDVQATISNAVSVQFGDGAGNFSTPTLFRGEPGMYSIAAADLNGDGYTDLVTANQNTDSASVYLNNGSGGFGGPTGGYLGYLAGGQTQAVFAPAISTFAFVDVNNDGHKDLLLVESGMQGVSQPYQMTVLPAMAPAGSVHRFDLRFWAPGLTPKFRILLWPMLRAGESPT